MLVAIIDIDKNMYLWCNRYQSSQPLMSFFRFVSHTGDGYLYIALAAFAALTDTFTGLEFLYTVLLAYSIEIPLFIGLKHLVKRDRPFVHIKGSGFAITPSDKFSLPSGHTAAAFLMATIIYWFYSEYAAIAYCWAGLIGLSRVMLGVHYPTDILAGCILGVSSTLTALISLGFY